MDSDDEEMCDAAASAPSSPGGGVGEGEGEEAGGMDDGGDGREEVVIMDVMWFQVDLDYEFDAPRWFDLTQEEAPRDAAAAQEWFAAAPSYPPSRACSLSSSRLAISTFVSPRAWRADSGSDGNGGCPVRSTLAFEMRRSSTPTTICVTAGLVGESDGFRKWAIWRVFFPSFFFLSVISVPSASIHK
jgi:hypothetical protein